MIFFFGNPSEKIYALQSDHPLDTESLNKLTWLFGGVNLIESETIDAVFIGPRAAMITPWSTNAVEITQNMAISGISRIEEFYSVSGEEADYDPMLSQMYHKLDQGIFTIDIEPEAVQYIDDIQAYNQQEGLALNEEEVTYLNQLSEKLGRKLTDSEVFGFSQVNSEHCRHKIFNGTFVIDGEKMPMSLFQLIKKTSREHPNDIVSAYKDNVAFIKGPHVTQFAPASPDHPDDYMEESFESVISVKAETHNFPTTVEPFNGAATGSGGEIRDRLGGGKGAIPLAGTAVYMTSYSRLKENRPWEKGVEERTWLYQTPMDILIKASNGASDFGNKFGQPLIAGSVLTFEHEEHGQKTAYDKVIMLAGGIGYGKLDQSIKDTPNTGDKIVVLGGDNYRIGMGGAAVSSADTGEYGSGIELNAVQRSNPEMQKRVSNTITALVESNHNPVVSIHDHGAGGHLNCLSELVEDTGGKIEIEKLPIGDPTLSLKEIIGNESQERMGLVIAEKDLEALTKIAQRERAPMYVVGEVTGDNRFSFESTAQGVKPIDLELSDMFGSSPKTIMNDSRLSKPYTGIEYEVEHLENYLSQVLRLEAVACKDWLTNKVDRCVGGRVAIQQCVGPLQLPLNNCGVMAMDFNGRESIATSIGHSPVSALIDPEAGSRNSIAEALTNIIWAPLKDGLTSISLSANWMWPCKNPGEDARLYDAVKAVSDFAIDLGINIPTGKDSLSMAQKYSGETVLAPGTVIISAAGNCDDLRKVITPVFRKTDAPIYYINISGDDHRLGGSSFAQVRNKIGNQAPTVQSASYFRNAFNTIQEAIRKEWIIAGHDIGSGGLVTSLLEMCFPDINLGAAVDLNSIGEEDSVKLLFSENTGLIIQASESIEDLFNQNEIHYHRIGRVTKSAQISIVNGNDNFNLDVKQYRDIWYETSYLLDDKQTASGLARDRYDNYKNQPLKYHFPEGFTGQISTRNAVGNKPIAAILREQGSNSEREMANALYKAGFEVRDVHMTDLMSGRETLEDVQFLGAVGGFSNSDVLGSAKGWAGAIKYNDKARKAIDDFFHREDTLSIGICNGCQLFMELDLINPEYSDLPGRMHHNNSFKHECQFTSVTIQENHSVMMQDMVGLTLGVWISHGEGKFHLPKGEDDYHIVGKYGYAEYPANPNGSDYNAAFLASKDGRHLVTMPHIERSFQAWNWPHYPEDRNGDEVSPWALAFVNARKWLQERM
ncbi:MAG: phosphoribosylformylglycinamidine synthase [Saprospiraceae bacterium]|nr:phosphoribosylformylglycinamidine synthase [Saprospiraceae bacterium]